MAMTDYAQARSAYTTDAAVRDTLGSVAGDLEADAERLQKLFVTLDRIADHVDGSAPTQAEGVTKLDTPPHSLLDTMRRRQRTIGAAISRCENSALRIANALGI